ncbi:hypothetical protein CHEID_03900 [Corynebacterium heidelbergense]|uniref:DUF3043 domain-containing protein n=1 Tax=Corynebacterium heidelbergense TaxID=2055947 RepID=A0A364VD52_9CORY|nr:DUF3043 domain-containing protein [Corynebacterium heidelbergense]WCZ36331.1 hypothetical protein CHEID_03900 [Corynebacterium heidelbergense]
MVPPAARCGPRWVASSSLRSVKLPRNVKPNKPASEHPESSPASAKSATGQSRPAAGRAVKVKRPDRTESGSASHTESGHSRSTATSGSADHPKQTPQKQAPQKQSKAFTPKKGRPTPKRDEQERRAGVRRSGNNAPPETPAEARKRRKELKRSMSKEDYKALQRREREERTRERRKANERMMAGDEQYLMDRDKGPERRFVRDWVDSHRYVMNLFLPLTLVVIIIMVVGLRNPFFANLSSLVMMAIFIIMVVEGIFLGRKVNRMVREKFPHSQQGGFSLGMYAFTRATMLRRFRTPAAKVNVGDSVR